MANIIKCRECENTLLPTNVSYVEVQNENIFFCSVGCLNEHYAPIYTTHYLTKEDLNLYGENDGTKEEVDTQGMRRQIRLIEKELKELREVLDGG